MIQYSNLLCILLLHSMRLEQSACKTDSSGHFLFLNVISSTTYFIFHFLRWLCHHIYWLCIVFVAACVTYGYKFVRFTLHYTHTYTFIYLLFEVSEVLVIFTFRMPKQKYFLPFPCHVEVELLESGPYKAIWRQHSRFNVNFRIVDSRHSRVHI